MSYDAPPPPPDPSGQNPSGQNPSGQNPYGQNPYGQPNPYGQTGAGQPGYGQPGTHPPYAHWGKRVGAFLIDALVLVLAYIPVIIGIVLIGAGAETTTVDGVTTVESADVGVLPILLIALGGIAYLAVAIWNLFIKQGRTGYTIGKGVLGIKLIGEQTGQPIGAGKAFLRQLAHILDSFCYIGYLWPLWDSKRQTFADKIMTTIVVDQPKG